MKLVLFGPPGSGKGTYASRLESRLGIAAISTGDIFREAVKQGSTLGKEIKEYLDSGRLVPDERVIPVVRSRITGPRGGKGFVLDGFPRTVDQASALENMVHIDAIVNLSVPEEIIIRRLSTRRTCRDCGAIFNLKTMKPRYEGVCDRCQGPLVQREDDTAPVIKERLRVFEKQSRPLIDYYRDRIPLLSIACDDLPPEDVVQQIITKLEKLNLLGFTSTSC